jgi:hypothetical protein
MALLSVFLFLMAQPALAPAGTRLDAKLASTVKTRTSKAGDSVVAILAGPIRTGKDVVVPQGSRLNGRIETVAPGEPGAEGRVRLAFREIEFPDGRRVSTWITSAFTAPPARGNLRSALFAAVGATAGGVIGGKGARVTGILGGAIVGYLLAGASGDPRRSDLTMKPGQILHLELGEDLAIP